MNELLGPEQIAADPAFPALKTHVVALTGLAYFRSREADLAARLRRRMVATDSPDCAAYLELARDPRRGEQDALVHELTIGETHFFRFAEQFEALRRTVIPELIRENQGRRQLRIWSAGCSIGPEVYSLAILLQREFGTQLQGWSVSIVGTDIDPEFLERARLGVYAEWALRGLPESLRKECFVETAAGWRVDRRFTQSATFVQHNLVQDPIPPPELAGGVDLILCRNVMIYFDEPTIRRVVTGLRRSLAPRGWLLVGHAEGNSEIFEPFKTHQVEGAVLFQNRPGDAASGPPIAAARTSEFHPQERPGGIDAHSAVSQLQTWQPYRIEEATASHPVLNAQPVSTVEKCDPLDGVRSLIDQGAWSTASDRLQDILNAEPLNPLAHYYQGLVFAQSGLQIEAEAALKRALFLEPDLPLAYYHLGLLLAGRGAHSEAQKAFRNTLRAVENRADDVELPGSNLTISRLRDAALLQLRGASA